MIFKDCSFFNVYKNILRIYDTPNIYKNVNNRISSSSDIPIIIVRGIGNIADMILDI